MEIAPEEAWVSQGWTRAITIAPAGPRWAIKHGDGYLGYVPTLDEAVVIARALIDASAEAGPADL